MTHNDYSNNYLFVLSSSTRLDDNSSLGPAKVTQKMEGLKVSLPLEPLFVSVAIRERIFSRTTMGRRAARRP